MTEEEAKKKWCPMARNQQLVLGDMGWDKEISDIHPAYRCIGSDCAVWVWTGWTAITETMTEVMPEKQGRCGLVCKP